jgi:hypothetical protein
VILERKRLLSTTQSFQPLLLIAPETVLSFVKAFEEFDPFLVDSYLPVSNRSAPPLPLRHHTLSLQMLRHTRTQAPMQSLWRRGLSPVRLSPLRPSLLL